jgi:hypothetical protein
MLERKDDLKQQLRLKLGSVLNPSTPNLSPKKEMD